MENLVVWAVTDSIMVFKEVSLLFMKKYPKHSWVKNSYHEYQIQHWSIHHHRYFYKIISNFTHRSKYKYFHNVKSFCSIEYSENEWIYWYNREVITILFWFIHSSATNTLGTAVKNNISTNYWWSMKTADIVDIQINFTMQKDSNLGRTLLQMKRKMVLHTLQTYSVLHKYCSATQKYFG